MEKRYSVESRGTLAKKIYSATKYFFLPDIVSGHPFKIRDSGINLPIFQGYLGVSLWYLLTW